MCPAARSEVNTTGKDGETAQANTLRDHQELVLTSPTRCARNCYNCPSCTSPLHVTLVEKKDADLLKPDDGATSDDSYLLFCQYCDWTTLDIGLQFSRPTKITEQINKARKARYNVPEQDAQEEGSARPKQARNHDGAFERLSAFYKEQLNESGEGANPFGNSAYGSPANLARIMGIYGGLTNKAMKKNRAKPQPMREAATDDEGFAAFAVEDDKHETDLLQKMQDLGWDETVSEEQALSTPANYDARFNDDLWPAATQLLAKRGKRCRACRQFIVRPEPKATGWRYKIRILASSNIPRLSLKPLQTIGPVKNPSFAMRTEQLYKEPTLKPYIAQHYILTLRNPLFETVKVTLATPVTTPGRVASKVTILCPSFTIGAAGDQWDDALYAPGVPSGGGGRQAATTILTGSAADTERQPEAGKVWERTRNSTSVILEIVPGSLEPPIGEDHGEVDVVETEDDGILEIPVYVRVEWSADTHGEKGGEKEPRELGYWCVLGVGRIIE
jgi:dynactin-4